MEASLSKGLFSRCVEDWRARGCPTPKVSGRESPSAASVELNSSAVDEGLQPPAADDVASSASSSAFAVDDNERASSQPSGGRARSEEVDSSSVRRKRTASASAAADDPAGQDEPSAPAPCVSEAELEERIALMFVEGAAGPAASGRGAAMPAPTKELVLRVWKTIRALCQRSGKSLSEAFGNFDQLVGQGWLIGDVVLGVLIEHSDAFAVGRKAGKLAPGLEAEFSAPARRVGKARFSSDEERAASMTAAKHLEADLRQAQVELPLPALQPVAPRAAKRQRVKAEAEVVKVEESAPAAPEPAVYEWRTVHRCRMKTIKVNAELAQAAVTVAEGELAGAKRALERARADYVSVLERTHAAAVSSRTDATYEALSLQLKQCVAAKSDLLRRADAADTAFEKARFQLQEVQLDIEDEEREARFAQAREEAMKREEEQEREREEWERKQEEWENERAALSEAVLTLWDYSYCICRPHPADPPHKPACGPRCERLCSQCV
jgi:hypothetical protein